jgi:hypothetical protein
MAGHYKASVSEADFQPGARGRVPRIGSASQPGLRPNDRCVPCSYQANSAVGG